MAMSDFSVTVREPELIRPDTPTPHNYEYLSNIDDQMGLWSHIPFLHVYRGPQNGPRRDPGPVVRQALSRALVHYYPLAGRLRTGEKGKLVVECTGEGVMYREADMEVTIGWLREANGGGVRPPFRHLDEFLVDDVWGCNLITDSPLLRVQVTRLACGGFILAYTFNHCVCDSFGAHQFISAVAEFARNPVLSAPSVLPAWSREILAPRSPPKVTYPHPEYDLVTNGNPPPTADEFRHLTQVSVFFSRADVASLKSQIGEGPTFDAVASCLWRARTCALRLVGPTRLLFPVDTRSSHRPRLPKTYYGVAVVFPCVATDATDLLARPLNYAADQISAVKAATLDDEYRASTVDFIEVSGRRGFSAGVQVFVVSDVNRLRFADVDLGWGPAIYAGPARAGTGPYPGMLTSVVGYRREEDNVEGLLALVSLPREAVEAFQREVREIVEDGFAPEVVRSVL